METDPSIAIPFSAEVTDWVALRTSARWEKKIAGMVNGAGVPVFLPTIFRLSRYASKSRESELPLFPGYVFTSAGRFIQNPAIPRACRSKVAQILKPSDPEQLRLELSRLAGLVTDRKMIQEHVVGQPGDRIVITGGPLVGNEGTIIRLKPNKFAVIVEITMLGAKLLVELSEGMIAKEI